MFSATNYHIGFSFRILYNHHKTMYKTDTITTWTALASPGFGARGGTKLRKNGLRMTQKRWISTTQQLSSQCPRICRIHSTVWWILLDV